MDPSHFLFNHSSDDTLDVLKQFLPQIQHQLRSQIQPQLLQQFAQKNKQHLAAIQQQAQLQYQEALQTLETQFSQLKQQKQQQLASQLFHLEQQYDSFEQKRLADAQQKFVKQSFDTRILTHQKIQQIADEMQNQLGQALLAAYEVEQQKKVKQLKVRLESRQQRQKKELDKAINAQVFSKSGLEELKDEVKNFRVSLASLKSKYNLKINGINKEIKQLNERRKQIEYPNSDSIIQQLQQQIQTLKAKKAIEQQSLINQEQDLSSQQNHQFLDFNQQRTFGINNHNFTNYPQTQYIHQDINLDSSDQVDQSSNRQQQSDSDIPMPPSHKNMISHLLSTQQDPQTAQQGEDIYLQVPKKPLLNFNISKMLRQKWVEDDLDRYLSAQLHKQNTSNNLPENTSNFTTLYQQHLDRLNGNPKTKMRKLSQRAKQNVLMNLSTQRQKRQQYALNV